MTRIGKYPVGRDVWFRFGPEWHAGVVTANDGETVTVESRTMATVKVRKGDVGGALMERPWIGRTRGAKAVIEAVAFSPPLEHSHGKK